MVICVNYNGDKSGAYNLKFKELAWLNARCQVDIVIEYKSM